MKSDENKTVPYRDERTDDEASDMNPETSGGGLNPGNSRRRKFHFPVAEVSPANSLDSMGLGGEGQTRNAPRRLVFLGLSRLAERIPEENLGGVFARGRLVVLRLYFGM